MSKQTVLQVTSKILRNLEELGIVDVFRKIGRAVMYKINRGISAGKGGCMKSLTRYRSK